MCQQTVVYVIWIQINITQISYIVNTNADSLATPGAMASAAIIDPE